MSDIPQNIYEGVHELALGIVNASMAGDDALKQSMYGSLVAFFEAEATAGRAHPFLTEAVADFTDDLPERIRLFKLAIDQSKLHLGEPIHTKMISLAESLIDVGRAEEAEAYLLTARTYAFQCKDKDATENADQILRQLRQQLG